MHNMLCPMGPHAVLCMLSYIHALQCNAMQCPGQRSMYGQCAQNTPPHRHSQMTAQCRAVPKADVHVQAVSIWASLPLLQRLEAFLLPYSMYQQQQLQSAAAPSTAAATKCAPHTLPSGVTGSSLMHMSPTSVSWTVYIPGQCLAPCTYVFCKEGCSGLCSRPLEAL